MVPVVAGWALAATSRTMTLQRGYGRASLLPARCGHRTRPLAWLNQRRTLAVRSLATRPTCCLLRCPSSVIVFGDVIGRVHLCELDNQPVECVSCLALRVDGQEEG